MKTGYSFSIFRFVLSALLLFPFLSFVLGQNVKINIQAPETVFVGEQFKVNYVIESETEIKEPIIIKNMENFSIIYGPTFSSSSSVSFNKGRRVVTYTTASTYYLEAQKEGKYTLPKAEIVYQGKKYKSDTFKLEVSPLKDVPDDVEAFVKAIVSRSSVNLSDTLMLTYRLYTTKEMNRIIKVDFPGPKDFFATDITRYVQVFEDENINGKIYQTIDLRKFILQPKNVGQITIPEWQIRLEYSTPTGRKVRDMWGDVYNESIKSEKTLNVDPVVIRVQDLKAI